MSFNTTPTTIADLNHFATDVFEYYDGKINLFNRHCNVILDWNGDGSGVLGSYSIPNTVILRMQNIANSYRLLPKCVSGKPGKISSQMRETLYHKALTLLLP